MPFPDSARINGNRLWSTIGRSAEIGKGRPGGLARLALTDSDKEMRDQFVKWCKEAGLAVTVDRVGSIFGRRKGRENNLPPVMIGSHLDTQLKGGRFVGILGVLTGLEIVRTLNDLNYTTHRPIEIVNWTNEEGSRFSPAMVAAGAFAGVYEVDWVLARPGDDGTVRIGDSPMNALTPINAYFGLVVGFARKYDKNAGVGTVVAMMLPYFIWMQLLWMALFAVWHILGLPWGI